MSVDNEQTTTDDNDPEEETPEADKGNKLIKDLRKQIRDKDKELATLRPLKDENAFLGAGLGKLSNEKKVALRAVAGDDVSVDGLKAAAKVLGFSAGEGSTTTTDAETQEHEEAQGDLGSVEATETAIGTPTGKPDNRDFVTKLNEAKSQEEVMQLIQEQGGTQGLLVESE